MAIELYLWRGIIIQAQNLRGHGFCLSIHGLSISLANKIKIDYPTVKKDIT
jgi:hypothetical protein